ncbi:methyltransferase domain-containing protein [Streptomyces sp. H27-H5]|uniref:methyltransferase domain-containing protein n=1 Tax=Streptomyces sp. H27-H5 TaxID=2996460 RepID=UPI00226E7505|nr:methyltransferase domain-containing protein [Streptomyces sp. H27-H5]MCY0961491.1 protein-L-isoaspartate(D-aspartate) O-methyltransferase [Streptomyces sp. H27-H5]
MDWQQHAAALARTAAHPASAWYGPLATVPRHVFVPRWYTSTPEGWTVNDGPADTAAWMEDAYADSTLVTRVGPLHADHAPADEPVTGIPTSSSTLPGLVVQMLRHARISDGARLLDVATGSGYSAALACRRLGDRAVTTLDVDPYLTEAAADRLNSIGLHPQTVTSDAGALLPGEFDRIVSMVGMDTIPASWLTGLRPGGRLVTTIANTGLIITADKTADGGAAGRVEWDRASFMTTRAGDDYPPTLGDLFTAVRDREGHTVTTSPFPVLNVHQAWEVWSMLSITVPGIEHRMQYDDGGRVTAWMLHPDGSWSRATTPADSATTTVHQGGPRRLWDELDAIRLRWLQHGELPVYGARVTIDPDGTTRLTRGGWTATL